MRKRSLGHFSERQNQQGLDPPNEYPEPVRASKSDGISPSTATQMMKATKAETLILDTAIQITRRWKGLQRLTVTTAERARESAKTTLRPAATTITTIVIIELFLKLGVADGIPFKDSNRKTCEQSNTGLFTTNSNEVWTHPHGSC